MTVLALLAAGLLLGLVQPAAAWRRAVLLSVGLPIMAPVARATGLRTAEPARLDVRIVLVALALALLGSYVGVATRHAVRTLTGRST